MDQLPVIHCGSWILSPAMVFTQVDCPQFIGGRHWLWAHGLRTILYPVMTMIVPAIGICRGRSE